MKILHTSDWHLGRSLYGRKRYDEFDAFLHWLLKTINQEKIDTLLVAGDVFDTSTPSNRAQEQYYQFLWQVSQSHCKHVVIIAGNHDSPSFLNAPKALLETLNVYVVGAITADPADEVIVLYSEDKSTPQAIICAVPYLRDKDIRTVAAGESSDDKNRKLIAGVKQHYAEVTAIAQQKREGFVAAGHNAIPIIGMGHLFTAGGSTLADDGVRELYVGSLAYVGADAFPAQLDYVALGHLHVPQRVAGTEHIRYCGSPIPMGFGEAKQTKQVNVLQFDQHNTPTVQILTIPCFQPLVRIEGDLSQIQMRLQQLKNENSNAWLEIEYTGDEVANHLSDWVLEAITDTALEVRRIRNLRTVQQAIQRQQADETLEDLDVNEVFVRCLDAFEVPAEQRPELTAAYNEILTALYEEDAKAQ